MAQVDSLSSDSWATWSSKASLIRVGESITFDDKISGLIVTLMAS